MTKTGKFWMWSDPPDVVWYKESQVVRQMNPPPEIKPVVFVADLKRMRTTSSQLVVAGLLIAMTLVVHEATSVINCQCHVKKSTTTTIGIACKNGPSGAAVCAKAVRPSIPQGYHYIPGLGLYKLHTLSKSYDSAQIACSKEGARLAIPQNEAMAGALAKLFSPDSEMFYAYIGVNDLVSTGFYQGVDGQLAPYLNWAKGEPNNVDGKEHCVNMGKDKLMNDFPCERISPFFCERKLKAPVPPGYVFVEGHGFYKVVKDKASFKDAEAKCQADGAHLAVPETMSEGEAMVQLIKADWDLGALWIGFTDEVTEGKFLSVHGTPMEDLEFENWSDREPNDANANEDCVTFLPYGFLNDARCTDFNTYICELVL